MSRARAKRAARFEGGLAYIPLTRGYEAVVDAADAEEIAQHNWRAVVRKNTVYASRTAPNEDGRWVDIFMHRQILSASPGMDVDHADRNGLNNCRANLRECSRAENNRNVGAQRRKREVPKGVKRRGRVFTARIFIGDREVHLGTYDTLGEASAAYYGAAVVVAGSFAAAD